MREKTDNFYMVMTGIVAVLIAVMLIVLFIRYEKEVDVVVLGRWWEARIDVTYTESYTTVETRTETRCYGSGETRACRTETITEPVTKETTHTRCSDLATGQELPAEIPAAPCTPLFGDRVMTSVGYRVSYRPSETAERREAWFGKEYWEKLVPGTRAHLVLNALGNVRRVQ